jgi:hypothetical protein
MSSFAGVAATVFALMLVFPLALWKRCGPSAHRLLKNDPCFGFFTPLVFPLAMGILADTVAESGLGTHPQVLAGVFVVFLLLAGLLIHADMKIGPLEPYMIRTDDALTHETEMRARLHALYRDLHTGDLSPVQKEAAKEEIRILQREASVQHRALAGGFMSWRDLHARGAGVAWAQVFVNSVVAAGCAALFSWLVCAISGWTAPGAKAANANMLCVGLLMLWFPLRIYSEWYTGFYTFRGLREYWTFWFLTVVAMVGILLVTVQLSPGPLPASLAAFGAAVLAIFGVLAKLKPELVGYAAVVFEEMPLIPYLLTLILGIFAVMLAIALQVTR